MSVANCATSRVSRVSCLAPSGTGSFVPLLAAAAGQLPHSSLLLPTSRLRQQTTRPYYQNIIPHAAAAAAAAKAEGTELGERGVVVPAAAERIEVSVKDLHPTQLVVGYQQVDVKRKKLEGMSNKKLDKYLREKKPIPVVIGPKNKYYMIDHHHLSRAMFDANISTCYVSTLFGPPDDAQEHDWSDEPDKDAFFARMDTGRLLYHFDEQGRELDLAQLRNALPKSVEDLKDDPYRSLSALIRNYTEDQDLPDGPDLRGYIRLSIPFYEFNWAQWLRKKKILPLPLNQTRDVEDFLDAALDAIQAARRSNDVNELANLPDHVKE